MKGNGENVKTMNKKRLIAIILAVVAVAAIVIAAISAFGKSGEMQVSNKIRVSEAQTIVDEAFASIAKKTAGGAKKILEKTQVTVNAVDFGYEKDVILSCSYVSVHTSAALSDNINSIMADAYGLYLDNEAAGKKTNATKVNIQVTNKINEYLETAKPIEGEITLKIYETEEGLKLFLSENDVDVCTGGLVKITDAIKETTEVVYKGETVDITKKNTLRTGIVDCISLEAFEMERPDNSNAIVKLINSFKDEFYRNFIEADRWMYLLQGLCTTLAITGLSVCLGVFLGFIVAIVRCTNQMTGKLKVVDAVCRFYLTVIRGTPLMVQLLIIYFVLLLPLHIDKFVAAVLCFGLNSGAYVAEIVRGGIMSVDKGQIEAGRSLGFNYVQTMINFVVPQAFKAILPALANEFITLLKESSVAFYIGVADLTQGGLKIRSITYSNFMPLIAVAIIYLILVVILTKLVGILERRLAKSDH